MDPNDSKCVQSTYDTQSYYAQDSGRIERVSSQCHFQIYGLLMLSLTANMTHPQLAFTEFRYGPAAVLKVHIQDYL